MTGARLESVVRTASGRSVLGEAEKPAPWVSTGMAPRLRQRPRNTTSGTFRD